MKLEKTFIVIGNLVMGLGAWMILVWHVTTLGAFIALLGIALDAPALTALITTNPKKL